MRDLYNLQIGFRAAIYRLYRYSTPIGALAFTYSVISLRCQATDKGDTEPPNVTNDSGTKYSSFSAVGE